MEHVRPFIKQHNPKPKTQNPKYTIKSPHTFPCIITQAKATMSSSDEGDAASDAPLKDCCNLSLGMDSDDSGSDDDPAGNGIITTSSTETVVISLEAPALSPPTQFFWESTQEEPFLSALKEWLLEKRSKAPLGGPTTTSATRSLETPSAFAAMERGNQENNDFSKLVQNKGSDEQKNLWCNLSTEDGDAFLAHLFLPDQFSKQQQPSKYAAYNADDFDSAWDDLCVNPQQEGLDSGREEGRKAGLAAGFRDGRSIGVLKGVEYGMEVGFIRGALQQVLKCLSKGEQKASYDAPQRERIEKTAASLSDLLDKFPSPDQIFQQQSLQPDSITTNGGDHGHDDSGEHFGEESPPSDLSRYMHAIRSKFKLLTVQMKWNGFSLKTIMDKAKQDEAVMVAGEPEIQTEGTDW